MIGLRVLSMRSDHSQNDRSDTLKRFKTKGSPYDVLLVSMRLGSYGLNFHDDCCKLIIVEQPFNLNTLIQAIGRVFRVGQQRAQEILILVIYDTNDYDQFMTNVAKIAPQLAAEGAFDGMTEEQVCQQVDAITQQWFGFVRPVEDDQDAAAVVPKKDNYAIFEFRRKKKLAAEEAKASKEAAKEARLSKEAAKEAAKEAMEEVTKERGRGRTLKAVAAKSTELTSRPGESLPNLSPFALTHALFRFEFPRSSRYSPEAWLSC